MRVQAYFDSGCVSTVDTTPLSYQDGMLADDVFLDVSDLEGSGVLLMRTTYMAGEDSDEVSRRSVCEPHAVVTPEEVEHVYAIFVDGRLHLARVGDRLALVAMDGILAGLGDGDEGA